MTGPAPVAAAVDEDKRNFPNCPVCRWRPAMKRSLAGLATLARLLAPLGTAIATADLSQVLFDYRCPKCKTIVPIRLRDLLRN